MKVVSYMRELRRLVSLLADGEPVAHGAIPWASPVMMFGDIMNSQVATLGLNPSNLEFEEKSGIQLDVPLNRFETLNTLGLKTWTRAGSDEMERIWQSCNSYFLRRPYNGWFKPLDRVIAGMGVSYYHQWWSACHLDLVPFATGTKWSELDSIERKRLIELGAPTLARLLRCSEIKVLVLNGASVVRAFEHLTTEPLDAIEMPSWSLPRKGGHNVMGYGYIGKYSHFGDVELGRELLVLGYNHNIQSSFGVTTSAVKGISEWIAHSAREALA